LRRAGIPLTEIGRFLADPEPSTIDQWLSAVDADRNERRNALRALATAMGLEPSTTEEDVMAITIRSVESHEELGAAFDLAGSQFEPPIDRSDDHRFGDLRAALERGENDLLLLAEDDDGVVGAALGFKGDPTATLRILAVTAEHRGRGVGRSLLRAFERAVRRAGLESIALGADEAVGFYVRHGYQTVLLLQWVYDASLFEREREIVLGAEILQDAAALESTFNRIPQLFVVLGDPNPTVRGQVADLVTGAHVGYCMIKTVGGLQAAAGSACH
jgi:ribosomal protein S18 acetylase RimI-like enzyme